MISPPRGPLARFAAAVVAVLVLAGAFMLGLAVLAVIVGIALVVSAAAWVRIWWLRRTGRMPKPERVAERKHGDGTIEAEYTVVSTRRERRDGNGPETGL
jgi:uncharacterized iron-regulated membrane protein